jgi:hypothetical protein
MNGHGGHSTTYNQRTLNGESTTSSGGTSGVVTATTMSASGKAVFNSSGNDPTSHTDTDADVHIAGGLSVAGHTWLNTAVSSGVSTILSDRRRKRKIVPKRESIVEHLRPVEYDLLDDKGKVIQEHAVGYVAQDVKELDSTVVQVHKNGIMSLDYRALGVHTVIEVQKLMQQQRQLLQRQKELTEQLQSLQNIENNTLESIPLARIAE